jgi:predicted RNA-binding protein with PUA-like domain
MNYWLIKSEPDVYGIDALQRDRTTIWDGVRNYQARNFLKSMQPDDICFYYHSNISPPGIVGLAKVIETNVIDPLQFDTSSKYYDEKSPRDNPRWITVKIAYLTTFASLITLDTLRTQFTPEELLVVRQGNRLSVMPVEAPIADRLQKLATQPEY